MRGRHLVLVVQETNWCRRGESKALQENVHDTFPFIPELAGPKLGWHQVKDAKNMKRVRVRARVWWWYPPSLDARSHLRLGLGGCVLADYVMDSIRSLLVGADTPRAGDCHLAHTPLGWSNLRFFDVVWYFQWPGAIYRGIVLCILGREDV